jgi:hypothetical protein
MIGIESFQYLQMGEGLRESHDAAESEPSAAISKAPIASANNTWFCENRSKNATGQAGHRAAIARHSSLTCGDDVA